MFCNAHHAFLGPWTTFTLINEAMPHQGLVTLLQSPVSVQPLSFVTGACWCNPTIPRHLSEASTSQVMFPQGSFSITTLFWGNTKVQPFRNKWCCTKFTSGRRTCPNRFPRHNQALYQVQTFKHPLHPFSELDRFDIFQARC